jgi:hypothetical protein
MCAHCGRLQAATLYHVSMYEGVACFTNYFLLTPLPPSLSTPRFAMKHAGAVGRNMLFSELPLFVSLSVSLVCLHFCWVVFVFNGPTFTSTSTSSKDHIISIFVVYLPRRCISVIC